MKNPTSTLGRLAVALAATLALASCNRSEYAMLPRSASYLGSTSVASAPRPAPVVATAPAAPIAEAAPVAPATKTAPVVAAAPIVPTAPAPVATARPAAPALAEAVAAAPAAPKPTLVQRLALAKVTKKINKLVAKAPQLKRHDATASTAHTARIDGNLRTGIILLIVGLLVGLLNGLIGTIIAIIGLVFIILWLLDQA